MHILLVGAGLMASEYAKVLESMNINYSVIGRGTESAKKFENEFGKQVLVGGLEQEFNNLRVSPTHAIVATNLESLEENTLLLLKNNVKKILVEKPGAISEYGLENLLNEAKLKNAKVFIAYNRRFYSSVIEAKKRIELDGGLTSFLFEFTEWGHVVQGLNKSNFELENWFIGNSTHVLDTAFYFAGKPQKIMPLIQSELDWHPSGSIYAGAGITENNILFSYHANWSAPGSWKLELLTLKNRYIFRPFEKLHVQKLGTVESIEIELDNELDIKFKPGIYRQVDTFLMDSNLNALLTLEEAVNLIKSYQIINGSRNIR